MTTLTITSSHSDFGTKTYISVKPKQGSYWNLAEWDRILQWCKDNLDTKGLEWVPVPQHRAIFMQEEAYFLYTLQHGITET